MQIVLTQKERSTSLIMHLIFWFFLKVTLREVAGFENDVAFQVNIKAELVCV